MKRLSVGLMLLGSFSSFAFSTDSTPTVQEVTLELQTIVASYTSLKPEEILTSLDLNGTYLISKGAIVPRVYKTFGPCAFGSKYKWVHPADLGNTIDEITVDIMNHCYGKNVTIETRIVE